MFVFSLVARAPELALDSNPLIHLLDKNPITQKPPSESVSR